MPLDKVNGETIGDLEPHYFVSPVSHWTDTYFWHGVVAEAERSFLKSGAILPLRFDESEVLVQIYPKTDRVAFVFSKVIAGSERFVPVVVKMTKEQIAELRGANRWPTITLH